MKYLILFNLITLSILLVTCNQGKPKAKINMGHFKVGSYCYAAVFEKDSAQLNFSIDAYGRVTGKLNINYGGIKQGEEQTEKNTGDITGEFRGDTLFADYIFTSGIKDKSIYSNPVALLHRGDSLTMGKGRIMSYLGRNYFDDKSPIGFDNSRFRFKAGDYKK